ncbi:uncharacterized protein LTR77_007932 [Saxophila tyrrhenica]|uniref:DUF7730 domain-containing protein n=1 Tax=Saxophila tyrrhenica TaxID=1690608 RepID=A0AAV9P3G1_9PEZI|nr:hypothetical protein LTR77_007932 [Saxophila tyrrhenica]
MSAQLIARSVAPQADGKRPMTLRITAALKPVPPYTCEERVPMDFHIFRLDSLGHDPSEPRASLLTIPQELRDKIWELAVVEPDLWYRRHDPRGPIPSQTKGSQRPVFECYESSSVRSKYLHKRYCSPSECDCPTPQGKRVCKHLCQGRPGLALLRTCRQIYNEADPIFWKQNMFCFENSMSLLDTLGSLPQSTLDKIQRLSALDPNDIEAFEFGEQRRRARTIISRLHNLKELEMGPEAIVANPDFLLTLSQLRYFRIVVLEPVKMGRKELSQPMIWVRVARDCVLGQCRKPEEHRYGDGLKLRKGSCLLCWQGSDEKVISDAVWADGGHAGGHSSRTVEYISKLLKEQRCMSANQAHAGWYTEPVEMECAAQDWGLDVGLFGLPALGPEERKRLQNEEKARKESIVVSMAEVIRMRQVAIEKHNAEEGEEVTEWKVTIKKGKKGKKAITELKAANVQAGRRADR